ALSRARRRRASPAGRRAGATASRIEAIAADRTVSAEAVRPVEIENGTEIVADSHRLMVVLEADARHEVLDRTVLAEIVVRAIRKAVTDYRQGRRREALLGGAVRGVVATALLTALVVLAIWLSRWSQRALEATYRQRVQSVGIQTFQIVRAEQIWVALRRAIARARPHVT